MNVIDTVSRGKESTYMTTFTIDADNNISAFATPEEAAASTATPFAVTIEMGRQDTTFAQALGDIRSRSGRGSNAVLTGVWFAGTGKTAGR